MNRTRLEKLYGEFWLKYSNALPGYIDRRPLNNSPFRVNQINNNEFEIIVSVDFKRLKYKSSSHRKPNIAVRIRGSNRFIYDQNDNSKFTQSNVNVNYFKFEETNRKTTLNLLESLHYDYETKNDSLRNHPIFHCQSCNDYINEPFFDRICLVNQSRTDIHQHLRIPTANMDIISVLLSVAADHFSAEEFSKILKVYDDGKWHEEFPHISHHGGFLPGFCFRSRAWYIG